MKRALLILLTISVLLPTITQTTFAQEITPVPTKVSKPTAAPTGKPTSQPEPTAKPEPTSQPQPTQTKNNNNSPTPTIESPNPTTEVTPTPTNAPKPLVATHTKPPLPPNSPVTQVANLITYPFALASNYLPSNFYEDSRFSPLATKVFLFAAFLFISSGTVLLTWPNLMKYKNQFGTSFRKEEQIPYIAR